jgi:hypothetical protein
MRIVDEGFEWELDPKYPKESDGEPEKNDPSLPESGGSRNESKSSSSEPKVPGMSNITITTRTVGNTTEQSYKIESADGSAIKEEKIDYVSGVSGQRNVIAVEGFVSEATYSRAIMIVVSREGAVGAWQGSTLPSDPSKYATIAETEIGKPLKMTKGVHYGEKATYDAVILNNNEAVPTKGDNPNEESDYAGQALANRIHLHSAYSDTNLGSHGCQTIRPFDDGSKYNTTRGVGWNSFYNAIGGTTAKQGDFLGDYYMTRL